MNAEDHPLFKDWLKARTFVDAASAASAKGEGQRTDADWAFEKIAAINAELSFKVEAEFERAYLAWRNPSAGA